MFSYAIYKSLKSLVKISPISFRVIGRED